MGEQTGLLNHLPTRHPPAQVAPAETPGLTGLLTLAAGVVTVAALYFGRTVLLPITLAVLLSFILTPLVNLLRRIWLGRILSVLLAVLLALGIILALGGLIGTQIADLAQDVPRYADTIHKKVEMVRSFTIHRLDAVVSGVGRQIDGGATPNQPAAPEKPAAETPKGPEQKPIPVEVHQPAPTAMQIAERLVAPVVDPLATTAIVFIVTIFILLQKEDLRDRLIRLFGSSDLHRTTVGMNDAAKRLSRYFLTQLGINTAFGIIIGSGLLLIGIPSPMLWGIMALLLRFVPYVGAPLAAVLPLALAAAVDPGWSTLVWTAALYAVTEAIMGQAVEPLLYGHSTGLSPFAVVVAATFWTWLWGPIGLILSTPLTLCLVVLGRHVQRLEFLDVILGDQPALTPVESFYQRMLAGDPDEAHDQAEELLKECSLASYYDDVALHGLRLAANDAERGVLTHGQLERIKTSIQSLIEDLDEHEDRDAPDDTQPEDRRLPAAWQSATPVLCVAGRGPLDEAASAMLVQLLEKRGLGARMVPHAATTRAGIGTLNTDGVAMICVSYLELAGSPSHLRYLLRRLRQRAPDVAILVGLWPSEDEILHDDRLRAAVGADYYASSLHEAVDFCLDAAAKDARHAVTPIPPIVVPS